MKHATRQKKQLATVKEWLRRARPDLEQRVINTKWCPEFDLLIAMEILVTYLEGEKEGEKVKKNATLPK